MRYRPSYPVGLIITVLLWATGCATPGNRPLAPPHYTIINPEGREVNRRVLIDEALRADVILVGEAHDNPSAHHMEYALFEELLKQKDSGKSPPTVTLSLEMLARDLQPITDEYLKGLITERHFIAASRPWGNYHLAYRRVLNLAKEQGAEVIAANAPRRYVNLVSRKGKHALEQLSPEAKGWIAPLPYEEASPPYRAKLNALTNRLEEKKQATTPSPHNTAPHKKRTPFIDPDAQALWDATMAWSIAEARKKRPESLVMHITGSFHCEGGLGIPEHLTLYDPSATIVIITIISSKKEPPLPALPSPPKIREYRVFTE